MSNNLPTRKIPHREVTVSKFDADVAKLPCDIRHYLLFECPKCLDPATVLKAVEAGYGLEWLRLKMKQDAIDVYGEEYFDAG